MSKSKHSFLQFLNVLTLFLLGLCFLPACSKAQTAVLISDKERVNSHLEFITKVYPARNFRNIESLNLVADYLFKELSKTCDTVYYQSFFVNGYEYKNVVGSLGLEKEERIVVGAHYDVCDNQQGADDNASGVAGVLELARLLKDEHLDYQLDFVLYTLEEPPFYGSKNMGSYVHALSLAENDIQVKGMICLEMIGYFDDTKGSQQFPLGFLRLFYGNKGNFITVVQKFGNGSFGRQVKRKMKRQNLIRTKSFKAPASVPGIDFSDHRNYWAFDYSAVMITNTAFYRNSNYHKTTDTIKTLDLQRMCLVIDQVFLTIKKLQ